MSLSDSLHAIFINHGQAISLISWHWGMLWPLSFWSAVWSLWAAFPALTPSLIIYNGVTYWGTLHIAHCEPCKKPAQICLQSKVRHLNTNSNMSHQMFPRTNDLTHCTTLCCQKLPQRLRSILSNKRANCEKQEDGQRALSVLGVLQSVQMRTTQCSSGCLFWRVTQRRLTCVLAAESSALALSLNTNKHTDNTHATLMSSVRVWDTLLHTANKGALLNVCETA